MVSLVCMMWMIFLSIEKCLSRVYALNDFSIDRKMSVSCVCFEWLLLSIEKCQSRVYALNDLFYRWENVSLGCVLWIFSIDRQNHSKHTHATDIERKNHSKHTHKMAFVYRQKKSHETHIFYRWKNTHETDIFLSIEKSFKAYTRDWHFSFDRRNHSKHTHGNCIFHR